MNDQPDPATFALAKSRRRRGIRSFIVLVIAIVAVAAGWWVVHAGGASVSTDNAYIRADASIVAPKVRGLVAAVLVPDNSAVATGTPLIRLDDEEYRARLAAADADAAVARAGVVAAQAALVRLGAEGRVASANETTAATAIQAADAEVTRTAADRSRQRALLREGFATRRSVETAESAAASAAAEAARARAALGGRARESEVTGARRAELMGVLAQARAAELRAGAAVALARQDLSHTVITAPVAGITGDRQVDVGNYVEPGTRLMRVVPNAAPYVVANFKETQTGRMRVGQRATVVVDALIDQPFSGRVESFAPGSGSDFALLPFEPGTGNFTKIVQRVPIRIRLDAGQPGLERLRSGLSAEVTVKIRDD